MASLALISQAQYLRGNGEFTMSDHYPKTIFFQTMRSLTDSDMHEISASLAEALRYRAKGDDSLK